MRWIAILVFAAGLFGGCAPEMTQMEACPETWCPPLTDPSACWPPYDRELQAMAERDLTCPREQLHYSVIIGVAGNLVDGCGQRAFYVMKCDEVPDGDFWNSGNCHSLRSRYVN